MSFKSWRRGFYPYPASRPKTALKALEHSLRKWLGLRPEYLKEHGCVLANEKGRIYVSHPHERGHLDIDALSCALCHLFLNDCRNDDCRKCPLFKHLAKTCAAPKMPYDIFEETLDPHPMITLLYDVKLKMESSSEKKGTDHAGIHSQ